MKDGLLSNYKISLMMSPATHKTKIIYVMKIPFPLNCVPLSPSISVHLWMLRPACQSLSLPLLSLVERRNQGCSEAPVTETLVHIYAREVTEAGRKWLPPQILQAPAPSHCQR